MNLSFPQSATFRGIWTLASRSAAGQIVVLCEDIHFDTGGQPSFSLPHLDAIPGITASTTSVRFERSENERSLSFGAVMRISIMSWPYVWTDFDLVFVC
jgi:hypothetical protein